MKYALLLLIMLVCCGCAAEKQSPFADTLLPVSAQWKEKFGDTEQSRLYFNLFAVRAVVDHNAKEQNKLAERIGRLEDPNGLIREKKND